GPPPGGGPPPRPPNRICPSTSAPDGSSRLTARAVIVLPEPDSPTRPTDSPGSTARDTPRRTARLVPATSSHTVRSSSSSSGSPDAAGPGKDSLPPTGTGDPLRAFAA